MTTVLGTALVTGGTDGIGAATALELVRRGADVIAIGRSPEKAAAMAERASAIGGPGSLRVHVADLGLVRVVRETVAQLADEVDRIDLLVHAVGVLVPRVEHTAEGIEKDLAVSYLGRFELLEQAHARGLIGPWTRLVNVAASSPRVPRLARVEFDDVDEVAARTGMRSHGQAQLANDLLTALAPSRYDLTAIGYGPGPVRTGIRREVPRLAQAVVAPFYHWRTRQPEDVGRQIAELLTDPAIPAGVARFHGKTGAFEPSAYVVDERRQRDLLEASLELVRRATAGDDRD